LEGCIPEVSYFKDLVLCCVDHFNNDKRIIQLQGKMPISMAPTVFRRMLRIPKPTTKFESSEVDTFLKANHRGTKILENFIFKPSNYFENSTHIEVCSFKYTYKEFT